MILAWGGANGRQAWQFVSPGFAWASSAPADAPPGPAASVLDLCETAVVPLASRRGVLTLADARGLEALASPRGVARLNPVRTVDPLARPRRVTRYCTP